MPASPPLDPRALTLILAVSLGVSAFAAPLDPAFRFASGGLALASPVVDDQRDPVVIWLLSGDGNLYALGEGAELLSRRKLLDPRGDPRERSKAFLALDSVGRAIVLDERVALLAITRVGTEAWRTVLGATPAFPPAFGSDGRIFLLFERAILCLNPAGKRLWALDLPSEPVCPPGLDSSGNLAVGLARSVLLVSPYGRILQRLELESAPLVLAPMEGGADLPSLAVGEENGRIVFAGEGGTSLGESSAASRARGSAGGSAQGQSSPEDQRPVALLWDGILLYCLEKGGRLSALSASGSVQWSVVSPCRDGRLELRGERLIVSAVGRAMSLGTRGEVLRDATIVNSAGPGVLSPRGLLFSPGADWILAAYRFEVAPGPAFRPRIRPYQPQTGYVDHLLAYDQFILDADRQISLLSDIEKSLRSGTIGVDEPGAAEFCAAVATGALQRSYSEAERRFRANPLPRARAVSILGALGSPAYASVLAEVIVSDPDSAVRAAACDALAAIGADPDGSAARAFLAAAAGPTDEQTALALVAAIETMALRSGRAPEAEAVRALLRLSALPYGASVRDRAQTALGRIAGTISP